MKKLLLAIIIFSSCAPRLHKTGTYTIDTRNGDTTTFKEVRDKYMLASDTIKAGDKVVIIKIKRVK